MAAEIQNAGIVAIPLSKAEGLRCNNDAAIQNAFRIDIAQAFAVPWPRHGSPYASRLNLSAVKVPHR